MIEKQKVIDLLDRLVNFYEDNDMQGSANDIRKIIEHIRKL